MNTKQMFEKVLTKLSLRDSIFTQTFVLVGADRDGLGRISVTEAFLCYWKEKGHLAIN